MQSLTGSGVLWAPWFWTLSLQNCEMINFRSFKPHSLWSFIMVPGNKHTHHLTSPVFWIF